MIHLYNNLPHLDLHGLDRDYARILINEFIYDNYRQQELKVIIVHGIGTGIIRKTTQETLKKNKYVDSYKIDNFNSGSTIVNIRQKIWLFAYFMVEYVLNKWGG